MGLKDRRTLRLIDTDLADPSYTAAVDEALLDGATGAGPALHLYRRKPPAVTIGYFLKAAEHVDLEHCRRAGIKVIRRLSGGGAIYTDEGQLVYGLATSSILPDAPARCFELACGALVMALSSLGCECTFSPVNDVVSNGKKLSGSAIINRGAAKLVHGTIIARLERDRMFKALKVSKAKLTSKGLSDPGERVTSLEEVLGHEVRMADIKGAIAREIGAVLGLEVVKGALTKAEKKRIDELVRDKYNNDDWNLKA